MGKKRDCHFFSLFSVFVMTGTFLQDRINGFNVEESKRVRTRETGQTLIQRITFEIES